MQDAVLALWGHKDERDLSLPMIQWASYDMDITTARGGHSGLRRSKRSQHPKVGQESGIVMEAMTSGLGLESWEGVAKCRWRK